MLKHSVCLLLVLAAVAGAAAAQGQKEWFEPFPPHRIADGLYYVGTKDLASYLITTPEGHILVNTNFERTVPLLRASVEKLGFRLTDIRIILTSQAHDDHAEGTAAVQQLTGGKVWVMEGDHDVIAKGGAGQYKYTARWRPARVDRVLRDGEIIKLGGVELKAHLTPGHTRGCTTYTLRAIDHGRPRDVVIVGGLNVNPGYRLVANKEYPSISADFARAFRVMKALSCEIFLGAHGSYYGLIDKHSRLSRRGENPFVDPEGYTAYVAGRERFYLETLAQQQR